MQDEQRDQFVDLLNKWKVRVEHLAFFFFLVLHLLLIQLIGISLLVQHLYKLAGDLHHPAETEKLKEKSAP